MNKFYVALLLVFVSGVLQAQSPGGVNTNLSLWLKADALPTGALGTWNYSNNGNSFTATGAQQPTVVTNAFNFLNGVSFGGGQVMLGPTGAGATGAPIPLNSLAYSIFAVWSSTQPAGSSPMRVWAQRDPSTVSFNGAAVWIYPNGPGQGAPLFVNIPTWGDQPEVSPYVTGVSFSPAYNVGMQAYAPNTTYISELNLLNQDVNDLELMDQTNFATGPTVTSTDPANSATTNRKLSDVGNFLGARSGSLPDENFNGNLAELIIYSSNVTAAQRSAIFSYLSLKYGVPLGGNYVSSTGTTIWDASANGAFGSGSMNYNHFIFGLGQDAGSGLTTAQSNSSTTGGGGGTGQSGLGNVTLLNPSALADQNFMLVGSNNAGFTETSSNVPGTAPAGTMRLPNQWLVQNSGKVGNVDLKFDFTGISTTGAKGTSSDFRLVVDNDGDGDLTTGTGSQDWYEPSSWDGTNQVATFSQVNLSKSTKVVFGIISNAPVNTPLPVNWVSFTAKANGPNVDLNWTVSANGNANVYDVERSEDGTSFSSIGQVANQTSVQSYGYVDANAGPGTHYYRVLETDRDGKSIYSKIVSVDMSASDFGVRLLNNPVVSNGPAAELEITAAKAGNASLEIWALGGTRVATMMQGIPTGTTRIQLPTSNLAPGTYAVKIRVNDVTQTVQIVKL